MPRLPAIPPLFPTGRRVSQRRNSSDPDPATSQHGSYLIDCAAYVDGIRVPGCADPRSAIELVRGRGAGFVWVGMFEPTAEQMATVAEVFGLHDLAVEDAVQAHQRPKLERYEAYLALAIKTLRYVDHDSPTTAVEIVETGEILMFLGADFIVTVRHGRHSELKGLRQDLQADPEHLAMGPAAVMHAVADRVVDHYLTVVEAMEDDIDEMEVLVFDPASNVSIEQIYLLKREVLNLRRAVGPLRVPMKTLSSNPNRLVPQAVQDYFRDVEDHLTQVAERVATFDELLTTLVTAALAEVTTLQNADLRKISSWAAIALVPTAIAGFYGMNFEHMPELDWPFGYPLTVGVIVLVCVLLFLLLRKRGWL